MREGWQRHTWYSQLHAELTEADDLARHRSASKIKRQGTSRTKQGIGGSAKREALLNPKAHRRVNRKQVGSRIWPGCVYSGVFFVCRSGLDGGCSCAVEPSRDFCCIV